MMLRSIPTLIILWFCIIILEIGNIHLTICACFHMIQLCLSLFPTFPWEMVWHKSCNRSRTSPRGSHSHCPGAPDRLFPQDILTGMLSQVCSLSMPLYKFMGNRSISLNVYIYKVPAELQLCVSSFCFYHDIKNTLGEGREKTRS